MASTPPSTPPCGPGDHWFARLAFHILERYGAVWITVWLILIIGGLVALGASGPWVPGAITTVGALAASGAAIGRRRASGSSPQRAEAGTPDPALEPPP